MEKKSKEEEKEKIRVLLKKNNSRMALGYWVQRAFGREPELASSPATEPNQTLTPIKPAVPTLNLNLIDFSDDLETIARPETGTSCDNVNVVQSSVLIDGLSLSLIDIGSSFTCPEPESADQPQLQLTGSDQSQVASMIMPLINSLDVKIISAHDVEM